MLNTNWAIFQLFHGEIKVHFDEMIMSSIFPWTNTLSWILIVKTTILLCKNSEHFVTLCFQEQKEKNKRQKLNFYTWIFLYNVDLYTLIIVQKNHANLPSGTKNICLQTSVNKTNQTFDIYILPFLKDNWQWMGFQYASSYRFVLAFVQISLQRQSMEFLKTKIRIKVKFAYFIKLKKWI